MHTCSDFAYSSSRIQVPSESVAEESYGLVPSYLNTSIGKLCLNRASGGRSNEERIKRIRC